MAFHTISITHYPRIESGGFDTPETIDNILSASLSYELGEAADSFSVTLDNVRDSLFEEFKIDDRLIIKGSLNGGTTESTLIDGIINNKAASGGRDSSIITLTGLNRLEKLFNAVVTTGGGSVQKTADDWVRDIIDQVNDFNNFSGTDREIKYNSSSIQDIPVVNAFRFDRAFEKGFKLIEELSQPENTGGKFMYYYLDGDNVFYWQERPATIDGTYTLGDNMISYRTDKGMFDVVNYIIMNGGKAPYGGSILEFGYDVDSISKYGWKVKVVTQEVFSNTLRDQDRASKPNLWDDGEEFPNTYPYTTVWGDTVNTNDEYNSSFVDQVRSSLQKKISQFLLQNGGASFKTDLEVTPQLINSFGGLWNHIAPELSWGTNRISRLDTINLSFGIDGWRTDLGFDDDNELQRGTQ